MILKLFPFENEIKLSQQYIAILQINNKRLFNRVANSLYLCSIGQVGEENIILVDEEKKINFEEEVLFLPDFWCFDCNHRKITNKLFSYIEENYKLDVEIMDEFQKHLQLIQLGIREITDELPFEVEMKQVVTVQDILKMLGIKLAKLDGCSLIERILTIIEIVEGFKLYSAIILCNVKAYLEENELLELYKHAICCNIRLMIVEYGIIEEPLANESIWYIDEDYEEFTY